MRERLENIPGVKKINIEENGTPIIYYRFTMPLSTLINN